MKKLAVLFVSFAVIVSTQVQALEILIEDSRCLPSTVQKIQDIILNFDGYKNIPGSRMEVDLGVIGKINLLEMVKSQSKFNVKTPEKADAFAYFVLKPVNLSDDKLFPRFLVHCLSDSVVGGSFKQDCAMEKEKQHFGLDDFHSHLEVVSKSARCKPGQVDLKFTAKLVSNGAHVNAIKTKVLEPAGVAAPLLEPFFDEEEFFRSYYESVYQGWLASGLK